MAHLATANMLHRRTRTFTSVLAVAIEVGVVMLLVGLADGTLGGIAERLTNVGADVLFQPPDATLILGASAAVMPLEFAEKMKQSPLVREVTPVLNWHISWLKGQSKALNLWAVDYPTFATISGGLQLVAGRALADPDDLMVDTVESAVSQLHVGDVVPMINREFKVVGIFRAGSGGRVYARIQDVEEATGVPGMASFFLVKARSPEDAGPLVRELEQLFPGYAVTPISQVSRLMRENAIGLQEFKRALTLMAVMISFLVVLLAMYTAVIERTRELGILRALGATQAGVVRLVLAESLLVCGAGCVVGFGVAELGRSTLLALFPSQTVALTWGWAARAGAMGLVGGLLGSLYPAYCAARMDPVDALNFE